MWFCCQLWHCSCLGQFDVWKAWSQVVHPTKAATPPSPSKFADSGSREDLRPNVFLEGYDVEEPPSCASRSTSSFELSVTLSKALDIVNESPRTSRSCVDLATISRSESPISGLSLPGRVMSRNSSTSFGEVLDSEAVGDHGYDETLSVDSRAEQSDLESRFQYWSRVHSLFARDYEEETDESSRCHDFGSREEVNPDQSVDSSEDEKGGPTAEEKEVIRAQYRRLWQLRATLEEDEELEQLVPSPHPRPLNLYNPSPVQSPETETAYEPDDTVPRCRSSFSCWPSRASVPPLRLSRLPQQRDTQARSVEVESEPQAMSDQQVSGNVEKEPGATDTTEETQAHSLHQLHADSGYRSTDNPPVTDFSLRYLSTEDCHGNGASSPQSCQASASAEDVCEEKKFVISDTYEDTVVPGRSECEDTNSRPADDSDGNRSAQAASEIRDEQPSTSGASAAAACAATSRPKHSDVESSDDDAEGAAGPRLPADEASLAWDSRYRCSPTPAGRRRALGLYRVMAAIANLEDDDHQLLSGRCSSGRSFRRDYSVDRKSDALFREFSQYEKGKGEIFPRRRRTGIRRHTTRTRNVTPNQSPSLPARVSQKKTVKTDGNLTDVPSRRTKSFVPFPNEENLSECSSALAGEDNSSE